MSLFSHHLLKKANANALFFSLIVCLIIGILISSFFLTAFYYNYLANHNKRLEKLELNLLSGTSLFLRTTEKDIPYNKTTQKNAPGNESGILTFYRKAWGVYDIGIINSIIEQDTSQKIILTGAVGDSLTKSALYIADEGRPILFAGKTIIKGDCYLPIAGIKRAYIDGNYFTEKKLIQGDTLKSNKKVPELNKETIGRLAKLFLSQSWKASQDIELAKNLPYEVIERSFIKPTLVYYNKQPLSLRRKTMYGNIIIVSDSIVELKEDNIFRDVIIIAKKIYISSSTKGNFQAFAKDTLWIESNTIIKYPSALGIIKTDAKDTKAILKIEKGSTINATIFLSLSNPSKSQSLIQADENSTIYGNVHSDNYAEIRGNLFGNLTCQKTVVYTPSAVYENHLYNANIAPVVLSKYYVNGIIYPSAKNKFSIVKYLD